MPAIYCDYNASTPIAAEVLDAMLPFLKESYGNPSSHHLPGRTALKALKKARQQVASLIGASEETEIIFTSGGTESNNIAFRSALATGSGNRNEIVISSVEHSSIKRLCERLRQEGIAVHEIGVDGQGRLDIEELRHHLNERTALVSIMLANNETGTLFPVEEIGRIVKARGILFHVDAVQAVGKLDIDLCNSTVDLLSLSAHKIYGPKGAGALFLRKDTPFRSFMVGGAQERGRRAGTENTAGIVGLGRACELAEKNLQDDMKRFNELRDSFERELCEELSCCAVNGALADRIANTSSILFSGIDGEALLMGLDQRGVFVSSGSACLSGAREPSYVLKAMGKSDDEASSSLRFSFGRQTTKHEIKEIIRIVIETVNSIKEIEEGSVLVSEKQAEAGANL